MQRISTATRFQDKFGPGKDGFRDGDPGLGTASTQLEALWFDNAQEEIANAIEMSGLALNPNDMTQLFQAIGRVVGGPYVRITGDTMTGPLSGTTIGTTSEISAGGAIRVSAAVAADFYLSGDAQNRVMNFTTDGWRLNFATATGALSYSGPVPGTFTVYGAIGATGSIGADANVTAGNIIQAGGNVVAGNQLVAHGQRILSQGTGGNPSIAMYEGAGYANAVWTDSAVGNLTFGDADGGGNPIAGRGYFRRPDYGFFAFGGLWPGYGYGGSGEFFCDTNAGLIRLWGTPHPTDANFNNMYQIGVIAQGPLANGALTFVTPAGPGYPVGGGAWNCDLAGNSSQQGQCNAFGYPGTSDERLKTNMVSWSAGLAEVLQINPISFEWKDTRVGKSGQTYYGVSAQEVQAVLPEAVSTFRRNLTDDPTLAEDTLAVESAVILYACVNAIKEITARLVTLETTGRTSR